MEGYPDPDLSGQSVWLELSFLKSFQQSAISYQSAGVRFFLTADSYTKVNYEISGKR